MLAQSLPALQENAANLPLLAAEKWMLCHLAYYNDVAFPARTVESFKRAWGMDTIERYPRTVGGTPGFVVAKWVNTHPAKVVVAIEGATSWGQIFNLHAAQLSQWTTSSSERVLTLFKERFLDILGQLAGAGFNTFINQNDAKIVSFAGHSLGAAIAECLAQSYAVNSPNNHIKLHKFGSPRVGNQHWVANLAPIACRESWYCATDPIQTIPQAGVPRGLTPATPDFLQAGFMVTNSNSRALSRFGNNATPTVDATPETYLQFLRWLDTEKTTDNPWYWHHRNAYRLMWCERFADAYPQARLRTRFLEMPDENRWGQNFAGNGTITAGMLDMNGTDPDDVQTGYVAPEPLPHSTTPRPAVAPQAATNMGIENVQRGQYATPRIHRGHQPR